MTEGTRALLSGRVCDRVAAWDQDVALASTWPRTPQVPGGGKWWQTGTAMETLLWTCSLPYYTCKPEKCQGFAMQRAWGIQERRMVKYIMKMGAKIQNAVPVFNITCRSSTSPRAAVSSLPPSSTTPLPLVHMFSAKAKARAVTRQHLELQPSGTPGHSSTLRSWDQSHRSHVRSHPRTHPSCLSRGSPRRGPGEEFRDVNGEDCRPRAFFLAHWRVAQPTAPSSSRNPPRLPYPPWSR